MSESKPKFQCPIESISSLIGESWTLLILREAFAGRTQFKIFEHELGIARNILSDRLKKLVEAGLLSRQTNPEDRRAVDYRLTSKGKALLPSLIVLAQWANQHLCSSNAGVRFIDIESGDEIAPVRLTSGSGATVALKNVRMRIGDQLVEPSVLRRA
ncbi:MAG: helix-turn-helix domain-containing protein [Pseudomonadota bacterium]